LRTGPAGYRIISSPPMLARALHKPIVVPASPSRVRHRQQTFEDQPLLSEPIAGRVVRLAGLGGSLP
jgi:hypothetical protein